MVCRELAISYKPKVMCALNRLNRYLRLLTFYVFFRLLDRLGYHSELTHDLIRIELFLA